MTKKEPIRFINVFAGVFAVAVCGFLLYRASRAWDTGTFDMPVIHGYGNYSKAGASIRSFLVRSQREIQSVNRGNVERCLIFGDGEMGPGVQYGYGPRMPAPMALGAADDLDLTYRFGIWAGQGFRRLGIDAVLAPVADVFDPLHPCILGWRCLGSDPLHVARLCQAYAMGMREGGVIPIVKHFPGHGATSADTHFDIGAIHLKPESYLRRHAAAFDFIQNGGAEFAVMFGHLATAEDSKYPLAATSQYWMEYLRGTLQFDGLVITDSANMLAVQSGPGGESGFFVSSLVNGCDLVLEPRQTNFDYRALISSKNSGLLEKQQQEASQQRIQTFYNMAVAMRDTPLSSEKEWVEEGTRLAKEIGTKGAIEFGAGQVDDWSTPPLSHIRLIAQNRNDVDLSAFLKSLGYDGKSRVPLFNPRNDSASSSGLCLIYWRPGSGTRLAEPWKESEEEWFAEADDCGSTYSLVVLGNPLSAVPFHDKPNARGIVTWGRSAASCETAADWVANRLRPVGKWPFSLEKAAQ